MYIHRVRVRNFRLLADAELVLENKTTLIVGRNNSGKTSLSEVIRRFLVDSGPKFQIEDFSSASYNHFCEALDARNACREHNEIRALIPSIELRLFIKYDSTQPDLGPLSDFVIDLDPTCVEALIVVRYELKDDCIEALFEGQPAIALNDETRKTYFRSLRELIPTLFAARAWAEDPNDQSNRREISLTAVRALLTTNFVNAQRGLDDTTTKETDVLAGMLEDLFAMAASSPSGHADQLIAQGLKETVKGIQKTVDEDFNSKLQNLIPTLASFGYPGLDGPEIVTETILDVKRILSNYTKVRYIGHSGILLPESYNGLGMRNLIFILLQIIRFYRTFRAQKDPPGVNLIFIEEPEAHLHPQMQEVFIRQLSKIAQQLTAQDGADGYWPVQFIVSTHSSHIANAVSFEAIRYFLPTIVNGTAGIRQTKIKDLSKGLRSTSKEHKRFLHQYLTLTRCDLFFADKATLVEGTTERLLLPVIIKKLEETETDDPKLSNQYMTTIEVGGAYAHIFFELLDFLELRTLIITDLDPTLTSGGTACLVHQGAATSNSCLNTWFGGHQSPVALVTKPEVEKIINQKRIAFQTPEIPNGPCGRTFEDAFMLANPTLFSIGGITPLEREESAWVLAAKVKKSEFALKHAIDITVWTSPGYIVEGLKWLAKNEPPTPPPTVPAPNSNSLDNAITEVAGDCSV